MTFPWWFRGNVAKGLQMLWRRRMHGTISHVVRAIKHKGEVNKIPAGIDNGRAAALCSS